MRGLGGVGPAVDVPTGCADVQPGGAECELHLSCRAGHVLESARDVTPVPGSGARKIA